MKEATAATAIALLLTVLAASIDLSDCQGTVYNCHGRQWKYYNFGLSWSHARDRCRQYGSELVTLRNNDEFNCLSHIPCRISGTCWIGLNDIAREGVYRWASNGERTTLVKAWWSRNNPDNYRNEDCVTFPSRAGKLNDNKCGNRFSFICEAPPVNGMWSEWSSVTQCSTTCGIGSVHRTRTCTNPAPQNGGKDCIGWHVDQAGCRKSRCPVTAGGTCPTDWTAGKLKCYLIQPNLGPWNTTASYCSRLVPGVSKMLTINSEEEQQEFVGSFLPWGGWVWINATDTQTESVWRQGNAPITYSSWNTLTGEPTGSTRENCAISYFQRGGKWADVPCLRWLHGYCEKDFDVTYGCAEWSLWSQCSVSCGGGERTRSRNCTNATGTHEERQNGLCGTQHCPVWSEYTTVTPCNRPCDSRHGEQLFSRQCVAPAALQDSECTEASLEWRGCNSTEQQCNALPGTVWGAIPEKSCDISGEQIGYSVATRKCTYPQSNATLPTDQCSAAILHLCSQPRPAQSLCTEPPPEIDGAGYQYVTVSRVEYTCDYGYKMVDNEAGNLHIKKCIGEIWTPAELFTCKPVSCPEVTAILHGDYVVDDVSESMFALHSSVTYSCANGYQFPGQHTVVTRVCQADGEWSGSLPSCQGVPCQNLTSPENGAILQAEPVFRHRMSVHFACNDGFKLVGGAFRECQADGQWSGMDIQCVAVTCPELAVTRPLQVQVSGTTYLSTASYTCDTGYTLTPGATTRQCRASCLPRVVPGPDRTAYLVCDSGYWSASPPSCVVTTCSPPPYVTMATRIYTVSSGSRFVSSVASAFDYNTTVEYSCERGYAVVRGTSGLRRCQENGQWSGQPAKCGPVHCPAAAAPVNGWLNGDATFFDSRIVLGCDSKHYALGAGGLHRCTAEESWSPPLQSITCQRIRCPEISLSSKLNVQYRPDSTTVGAVAQFSCEEGYTLSDSSDAQPVTCEAQCSFYRGNPVCVRRGSWTRPAPTCRAVTCRAPETVMNGEVRSLVSPAIFPVASDQLFPYNSTIQYVCDHGYKSVDAASSARRCQGDGQWSGVVPVCWGVQCPVFATLLPRNGWAYGTSIHHPHNVTTGCEKGYYAVGTTTGTTVHHCSAHGRWSPPFSNLRCHRLTCQSPQVPARVTVTVITSSSKSGPHNMGSHILFSCQPGYLPNIGNRYRGSAICDVRCGGAYPVCSPRGTYWTALPPVCTERPCGRIGRPQHGKIHHAPGEENFFHFGVTKTFSCPLGRHVDPENSRSRMCQSDGRWSGSRVTCSVVECLDKTAPPNGWSEALNPKFGFRQTVGCNDGFFLADWPTSTVSRSCSARAVWVPEVLPECRVLDCGKPSSSPHLLTSYDPAQRGSQFNGAAVHTCPLGFAISDTGNSRRACTTNCTVGASGRKLCRGNNAIWTGTPPTCIRLPCFPTSAPRGGLIVQSELNGNVTNLSSISAVGVYETKLTFGCDKQYKLSGGTPTLKCGAAGQWQGTKPLCVPVCYRVKCPGELQTCIPDPDADHKHKCVCDSLDACPDDYLPVCGTDGENYNHRCHVAVEACNTNTSLTVARDGFCQRAGRCSEEKKRKRPGHQGCPLTKTRYFYNSATQRCEQTYTGRCYTEGGDNNFQHMSECRRACGGGDPCEMQHDSGPCTKNEIRYYYDSQTSTCKEFRYGGCFGNENTFADAASCARTCKVTRCPTPVSPRNGQVSYGRRVVNSTATYTCFDGYEFNKGGAQRVCQSNATWNGSDPVCGIQCPPKHCSAADDLRTCSVRSNRPVDACTGQAKASTDIAFVARQRQNNPANCSEQDDRFTVWVRVREEIFRSSKCSFLPLLSDGRYNVRLRMSYEEGCPCPTPEQNVWYLVTAVCDVRHKLLVVHTRSIFRASSTRIVANVRNRCRY